MALAPTVCDLDSNRKISRIRRGRRPQGAVRPRPGEQFAVFCSLTTWARPLALDNIAGKPLHFQPHFRVPKGGIPANAQVTNHWASRNIAVTGALGIRAEFQFLCGEPPRPE